MKLLSRKPLFIIGLALCFLVCAGIIVLRKKTAPAQPESKSYPHEHLQKSALCTTSPYIMDFSVQPPCSLCLCGFFSWNCFTTKHTENTEVAQRRGLFVKSHETVSSVFELVRQFSPTQITLKAKFVRRNFKLTHTFDPCSARQADLVFSAGPTPISTPILEYLPGSCSFSSAKLRLDF